MRILTIVGARPQFIKAAVVSHQLRATPGLQELLVHTGQHYDENMSAVFFEELGIPRPDVQLGIGSGPHGAQTGHMLEALEQVLLQQRPDWVLVYGDTNSTLAGALAAAKLHIPVAHVEAGLRSFNRRMPEELNRVLTDHAANLLFVPTETALHNLQQEGITGPRVQLVGDVMYDAALHYGARAEQRSQILSRLGLSPQRYALATVHRAENTDDQQLLRAIASGLADLAHELPVVLPLHPRTRGALQRAGLLDQLAGQVHLIEPQGYLNMLLLEKYARLILTDSGGVQKEAYFYRVPCVTLRTETEWLELVEQGWNHLCPPQRFADQGRLVLEYAVPPARPAEGQLYGAGDAARKIAAILQGSAA